MCDSKEEKQCSEIQTQRGEPVMPSVVSLIPLYEMKHHSS